MSGGSSIETSSFAEENANKCFVGYYGGLFPGDRSILDFDFDRWIDDLIETSGIGGLFKTDDQDGRISGWIIDGINIILPTQFPQKNKISHHTVGMQYFNKAQQILQKLNKIESSDDYQQRKRAREAINYCFKWVGLSNVIEEFKLYQNTISEHIVNLKKQEDALQTINEESEQYKGHIANFAFN